MNKWYSFNFRICRPPDQEPRWWIDILILDCIVRAVVSDETLSIGLWRVHRRAALDESGHEFTFDCFITEATANAVDDYVQRDAALSFLVTQQLLVKPNGYSMKERGGSLNSISRETWPAELQEAWPFYIHGVCRALLWMIEAIRRATPDCPDVRQPGVDADVVKRSYQGFGQRLGNEWRDYGHDAFLHHLNAVFAYQPLLVRSNVHGFLMSF
jgi:hypothetical protein